ncbi:MAG: amidase family protein [Azospirillaceae bacterium]
MALRRPEKPELRPLASENRFTLSEGEEAALDRLLDRFMPFFDRLDTLPDATSPIDTRGREAGTRPEQDDDPCNAILRRCSVPATGSGALDGWRVGLKDSIAVAGVPMTCGSAILDYTPSTDSTLVARLLDAGAEIRGILNMDKFAFSGAGDTSDHGPTFNPHDPERLAGGSSGGSAAALSYPDFDLTFGADQGGSIRIPAAWCGVVGLKPTHGLIPYGGIVGLDHTYDHVGPMARTVAEVAQALEVVAGKDDGDPRQRGLRVERYSEALDAKSGSGLRIGVVRQGFGLDGADPAVDSAVREAIDALARTGAAVTEIDIPAHEEAAPVIWGLYSESIAMAFRTNASGYGWEGTYIPEMAEAFGRALDAGSDRLPPQAKLHLVLGTYLRRSFHGRLYAKAQTLRPWLREAYDHPLRSVDVLAMPTTPTTAHRYRPDLDFEERVLSGWSMLGNTAAFNMTGHPSISVPCGTVDGLPVGLMLTGRHFDDATVLAAAAAVEHLFPTG